MRSGGARIRLILCRTVGRSGTRSATAYAVHSTTRAINMAAAARRALKVVPRVIVRMLGLMRRLQVQPCAAMGSYAPADQCHSPTHFQRPQPACRPAATQYVSRRPLGVRATGYVPGCSSSVVELLVFIVSLGLRHFSVLFADRSAPLHHSSRAYGPQQDCTTTAKQQQRTRTTMAAMAATMPPGTNAAPENPSKCMIVEPTPSASAGRHVRAR